jgi:hypothetical protein
MKYENAEPIVQHVPDRQFLHTRTAGFDVMLLQSLATGLMLFAGVLVIGFTFGWMDPLKYATVSGVAGTIGWWLFSIKRWTSLTAADAPQVQVRSVDHDGDPSTPRIVRVQIDKVEEGGVKQWKMFDLPATDEQMAELAAGLLKHGRPFSEREWAGNGRPFSSNEFRDLRSELIKRGLIALKSEKDTRQGYGLTDEGKAVFEQFLP